MPTSDETHKTAAKCPSSIVPTNDESATTQSQSPKYTILEIGSKTPTSDETHKTQCYKKNWVVKKKLTNDTAYEDDSAITPTMMTTQHTQCMKRQINKQYCVQRTIL
ncbi:hypothetical protein F8M41_001990 [Gigaspora margarita]|uniref:Uncharacterized protein n=1 Tax=Gigaspora margarita TaxID=4874 RepID=A0A8H3XDK2_GIGMA|nr:hypothetical protein F8M41_001990 [Gigaspora margarita]